MTINDKIRHDQAEMIKASITNEKFKTFAPKSTIY